MRSLRRAVLGGVLTLAALGGGVLVGCAGGGDGGPLPPSSPSPKLGEPMPKIDKRSIAGEQVDSSQMAGKVVVVEFFAEYCQPCQKTLPAVQKLSQKMPDVVFVGVSIDGYESPARAMAQKHGVTFPVIHDKGSLRGRYRVTDLPSTFVVDTTGKVFWVRVGGNGYTESELTKAIAAARNPGWSRRVAASARDDTRRPCAGPEHLA